MLHHRMMSVMMVSSQFVVLLNLLWGQKLCHRQMILQVHKPELPIQLCTFSNLPTALHFQQPSAAEKTR